MEYDPAAEERKIVVNEIQGRWAKLSDRDLAGMKGKDDLISQVQSRYKLDREQALKDVEALLNGRAF
jgi:hypothetical protein